MSTRANISNLCFHFPTYKMGVNHSSSWDPCWEDCVRLGLRQLTKGGEGPHRTVTVSASVLWTARPGEMYSRRGKSNPAVMGLGVQGLEETEMGAFWFFNTGNTITEESFSLFSWERLKLGCLEPWTCASVSFPRNSNYSTSSNDICHYICAYYKPGTLPSDISWVAPLCQVLFCWPKWIGWVWSLRNPPLQLGEARAHPSKLTKKEQR